MTIRTVHLAPDLVVILRKGFEPLTDANGQPVPDKEGQPVYVAEAVVPGRINSRFAVDNDRPDGVRLRCVGNNPGHAAGTTVRLSGKVTATVWYQPRARGNDARSALTITAERVDAAHGVAPVVRGGLPAVLPPGLFLGQAANGAVDLMLPPDGSYVVEGVAELSCSSTIPADMIGVEVVPVGLRLMFVIPDREDTSARSKAELVLVCAGLERVSHTNGRARKSEPIAEPVAVEG